MTTSNEKNTATLLQLSLLSQYLIPFGNFIFPLLIWSSKKNESKFVDTHGKQALNFQLSMLLYSLIALIIAIPTCLYWFINIIERLEISDQSYHQVRVHVHVLVLLQ